MMHKNYTAYREVAEIVEDNYYEFKKNAADSNESIRYLSEILLDHPTVYERVCALGLLCQELALVEVRGGGAHGDWGSASENFDELFKIAGFDPISLISCAAYNFYDVNDLKKAKYMSIYSTFVAEHLHVHVRNAHQLLLRIAYKDQNISLAEISVRRILEYTPDIDSPDPAIENDIVRIVSELDLDLTLKAAFLKSVEG